ncbi:MAG: PQQ-binding-like beta-propeller repeat protein [Thermogutta sp.]
MSQRRIAWSLIPVVLFLLGCQAKQGKETERAEPPGTPAAKVEAVQPPEGVTQQETVPLSVTDENQQGPALADESSTTSGEAVPSQPPGEASLTAMQSTTGPYWPRFHGPRGDNISDDTGLLESWPSDGPPLVWKIEGIGRGYASVTIADGRIFTAGDIGDNLIITAMDMNGNILWQKANGPAWTKNYPGSRGTPTIDGDRVYHLGASGDLACFQVSDGKEIWRRNIMEDFHAPLPEWALAESVLVDERYVYCTPGGPETCVVALDKMTGELIWKSESADGDTTGYASIQRAELEGMPILLTMTAKAVVGVRADTGKLLFRHPHETAYDVNACMPLYADGVVVVSTGYGSGSEAIRLTRRGDTVATQQVWSNRELDNHHGGVLLFNGFIYGSSYNGRWLCLDWEKGESRYADKGVGKGSLTYADGMLYTFSERRMVGLVKVDPTKHELVSSFRLPSEERDPSWPQPVVCGGRLYLRHGNLLFAYDVRKRP